MLRLVPPLLKKPVEVEMTVTAYCACQKCCDWERNWLLQPVYSSGPNKGKRKKVGITSSGVKARKGTVVADTTIYPTGTILKIPGYGYGRVEDTGGAIKADHIDLFFTYHKAALEWGRQDLTVEVWMQ